MSMTRLDWFIVAFAGLLALFGFRRGFIVAVLSFAGFAIGSFIGTRLGPLVLSQGSSSPYAPVFGLMGALLAGAILATGFEGVGFRLRRTLVLPGLGLLDGALGAVLSAALGLAIAWILAAVVVQTAGTAQLRADIQHSEILRELNQLLPPTGPILNVLASLDPLPSIAGPVPEGAPPSRAIDRRPGVRSAERSVVRVLGTACGLAIEGSGWVAQPGVVVTNAHVVAGEHDTTVEVGGNEPGLSAYAIAFDPTDDIAILRVPGLDLPSLTLVADPAPGRAGAILGYPEDGPFDAQPGRIGTTQKIVTDDAYGRGPVSRLLTPLRGLVRPGNSGGPLVDRDGRV
ncbi:MAG TPA: MarP family serine protease, partial [Solirubrobacteraceae bacterium]|nr:MarP family serine protease [Solirubrobacteraceae bacterium]